MSKSHPTERSGQLGLPDLIYRGTFCPFYVGDQCEEPIKTVISAPVRGHIWGLSIRVNSNLMEKPAVGKTLVGEPETQTGPTIFVRPSPRLD